MPLSLDEIKGAVLPVVAHEVKLPELGPDKSVYVAELTALERETRVEEPFKSRGDQKGLRATLVAACLCKSAGRDFMAVEREIPALADTLMLWPLKAFDRLFSACELHNGLGAEAQEQHEKN